jgi:hypothetical protein
MEKATGGGSLVPASAKRLRTKDDDDWEMTLNRY